MMPGEDLRNRRGDRILPVPQSDLDGPGEDAVEFVNWLRNNRVPASNIFLFLSLLGKNIGAIQARLRSVGIGVVSQPAISNLNRKLSEGTWKSDNL